MLKRTLLVLAITLSASSVLAQNAVDRSLITVTGQAEVRVPPDEVVFTLSVESIDKDMLAAKRRTDDSIKNVLSIAKKNNIKPEDVQTSYISVQPKYNTDDLEYDQRRTVKRLLVGYEVSKTVAVILRDISKFDQLLSDVLSAGVTRVSNVAFRDSQVRKHKDQARAMAMKAAQEKATLMAREIGQSIGPAYSISESEPILYRDNMTQNSIAGIAGNSSGGESEDAIAPGMISVTARVTVSFQLK